MTRIDDREDDDLLYDMGGREHPSVFFLDAKGEVVGRHDMSDPSVDALRATGDKVRRSLDLVKKAEGGDAAAKTDLAILKCDLGVTEFSDLEMDLDGVTLTEEQSRAVGVLRADSTVSDMLQVLAKNRDQAAQDLAAEEFLALYGNGTHPARLLNRRFYWSVIADQAVAKKDPRMLKDAIAGFRDAMGPSPRAEDRLKGLEEQLKQLEAPK